jgi:hypothetical protein
MKAAWTILLSSTRRLIAKRLLLGAATCFALVLAAAGPASAQCALTPDRIAITCSVSGTAGFDTGLQRVANLILDHVIHLGDGNPLGAVIHWGDGTLTNPGLLHCGGVTNYDPCDVYGTHRYASEGTYTITVEYDEPSAKTITICTIFGCITIPIIPFGNGQHHSETSTATISPAGDFVILSIGDSIASGEGDPVIPSSANNFVNPYAFLAPNHWAFWDDPYSNGPLYIGGNPSFPSDEVAEWPNQSFPCHRSILAGPAQAGLALQQSNPGVTFVHFACSGAKINAGDTPKDTVQDAVGQLRVARGRLPRIDALIISAGSNSFYGPNTFGSGFGALFEYCITSVATPCSENQNLINDVNNSLNALPAEYARLAKEINCINPDDGTNEPSCTDPQNQIPKLVLITEYMDPTHDQNGNYSTALGCPVLAFKGLSASDWQFFHDVIVHPLNQQVDSFPDVAYSAGLSVPAYAVTGIEQDFLDHGLCAGDQRWVLTPGDSESDLGVEEPHVAFANGSGHPNSFGQADYRERIKDAIVQNSYAVTTASATAGGMSYTFGTWTAQNVVVTLSATNPIQQSGAKQILYAVDNSNCNPQGWPTYCSTYSGPFTISTSGQHTVTFSSVNASNLLGPFQTVQVWVGTPPATTLTITANNASRQYGAADPAFTATYTGFVNGDTPAVLAGALTCAANDTANSPVGTYLINCSGLSSTNYSITYVPGLLSITPAPLTFSANNVARPYGQANPSFTGTIVGLLNGDNVSASYSSIATPASVVGSYAIAITPIDPSGKLANYTVTLNNGTLTISSLPLTITANNASRLYGAADPSFTASYSGFVNGDTSAALGGTLTCAGNDTPGSPAGTYAINCSGQTSPNYSITYVQGTLTITAAPLVIAANNTSRQYGAPDPAFTATYTGFMNGDTPAVLTGALACTGGDTASTPVGAYVINCSGLSSPNYSISNVPGTLAITPAPLTVVANNASRPYGANNPVVIPTVVGLLNGDTITATDTIGATPTSPVGAYPITGVLSDSPNRLGNYAVAQIPGTLFIVPESTSLAVTFSPLSMMVGQSTIATVTLTAPDMVIPMDPSVLAPFTLTSPVASDIFSNGGVCTPVPSTASGLASCTVNVTSVEPNGRTINANFAGGANLAGSTGSGDLMVTAALLRQQVCLASDFRNVAVPGGSNIWFNSIFRVRDVTKQLVHVTFFNSSVQFQYADPAGNTITVNQRMPDADITMDPNATVASTVFDPVNNVWVTTLPWDLDDNAFLTGLPWLIPSAGLPSDVEPVTWCGTFASDVANIDIGWRWAAAAYSTFSSDNTTLGVKPIDTDHDNQATNHDRAGTPENYKQFVIPGARGKGGKNHTGTYSRSAVIE